MKFKVGIPVLAILVSFFFAAAFLFIVFNPPLVQGTIGTTEGNRSVMVGVGNKGFRDVTLDEVLVNNDEKPLKVQVQVSHALRGFIVTESFDGKDEEEYGFTDIEDVNIKGGTSPEKHLKKLNEGTATENDTIYGITILHDEAIKSVRVKYRYIEIPFEKVIAVPNH